MSQNAVNLPITTFTKIRSVVLQLSCHILSDMAKLTSRVPAKKKGKHIHRDKNACF